MTDDRPRYVRDLDELDRRWQALPQEQRDELSALLARLSALTSSPGNTVDVWITPQGEDGWDVRSRGKLEEQTLTERPLPADELATFLGGAIAALERVHESA